MFILFIHMVVLLFFNPVFVHIYLFFSYKNWRLCNQNEQLWNQKMSKFLSLKKSTPCYIYTFAIKISSFKIKMSKK